MMPDTNKEYVSMDDACKALALLIRNPYAVERRLRKEEEYRDYVRKAWSDKYISSDKRRRR